MMNKEIIVVLAALLAGAMHVSAADPGCATLVAHRGGSPRWD